MSTYSPRTIATVQRIRDSKHGSPRWRLYFKDGSTARTFAHASWEHGISPADLQPGDRVQLSFDCGGYVTSIRPNRPTHFRIVGGLDGGYIPSLSYCLDPDCDIATALESWKGEVERWAESDTDEHYYALTEYADGLIKQARDRTPVNLPVIARMRESEVFPGTYWDYVLLEVCDCDGKPDED